MKCRLLRQIKIMSTYAIIGVYVQCLLAGILMAADSNAQQKSIEETYLSISIDNLTLEEALLLIGERTEFNFQYNKRVINKEKLNMEMRNASLGDLLREISNKTGLSFKRINETIYVSKDREEEAVSEVLAPQQGITVTGRVTSEEDGEGLPGVNVIVKGTAQGTVTDVEGKYSIDVPDENTVLVFSSVGYVQEEIVVGNNSVIDLALTPDVTALEEIVVIGYGTVTKSDLTGSVGSIKSEEIEKQPVVRVDQALQGRIAGVQVSTISGAPGTGASIRIRGGNSISAGNEPLYVIDGLIGGGDLNSINPDDIESVEVLKDASATAIYGSRGSNGVILITTKRGTGQEGFGVSLDSYIGLQTPVRKIDMLNGPEFADYRNEYSEFLGEALPFPNLNEIANTDWQEVLFRDVPMMSHTLNIYNNTASSNYFFSLNYLNQDGIQLGSGFDRYQLRFNFDQKLGRIFRAGTSLNISYSDRENPRASALGNYVLPTAPIYLEDGSFHRVDAINGSTYNNPVAQDELISNNTYSKRALGNIYLQLSPIEGLDVRSTLGFDYNVTKQNIYNSVDLPTNYEAARGGQAFIYTQDYNTIQNENTITYSKEIGDHRFTALAGWTYQAFSSEDLDVSAYGFTNDVTTYNAIETSDPELLRANSDESAWTLLSGLYRLNYSYRDKYLLTVSGRHDGSSRLAEGNKWQFFPSAAIAWRLIEEDFIAENRIFSDLKLRASYGKTGSQAISPYATQARLNSGTNYLGGQQVVTFVPAGSADPSLTWEVTDQYDIGLEVGFFENRLSAEIDYYYKKTTDLLLARELPFQTGFTTRLENVGSLQNQGVDVTISGHIIDRNDFSWSADLTVSTNTNKILELSGGKEFIENGLASRLIVGESVSTFFGAKFIGLWQEEDPGLGGIYVPGAPKFEDLNEDGLITALDGQIIGEGTPDFYGGFNNVVTFRSFTLSAFFDFSYGNDIYDADGRIFNTGHASNVYGKYRNRWTPENTETDVPRAGTMLRTFHDAYPGEGGSSINIYDGSYVRLRNLNLQYNIPVGNKIFTNLGIYATATNVFTLTKYEGFSPDTNAEGTHPTRRGFDSNGYPPARMYLVGFKADF